MSEYKFIEATCAIDLEERVNQMAAQGYQVIHMTQSEDEHAMHYLVCMKKAGAP